MNFKPAPIIENEIERLKAVDRTGVMSNLENDGLYEIFCFLEKEITGCSLSWTGLIDDKNQFCIANDGLPKDVRGSNFAQPQTLFFFICSIKNSNPLILKIYRKTRGFSPRTIHLWKMVL